jgi:hypothetical protein
MTEPSVRFTERKRRWVDFMDLSLPPRSLFLIDVQGGQERPWPFPENRRARIDWALTAYERNMGIAEWLEDDRVPCLSVYTGTEIFAEAFGCRVHRPEDNMPFALPLVQNAREAFALKRPDLSSTPLVDLFGIADELLDRAGKGAILQIPDMQSPLDVAALIWEKADFYMALVDEPDAVLELCAKILSLQTEFFDVWFDRYGVEYVAHYPSYFMVGGLTVSEDEVGAIDREMFQKFALPDLAALSDHFGGLGLHCCANARHQWGGFKHIPNLRLLNLVQPIDVLEAAHREFASHVSQYHLWQGQGEPWTWPEQTPADARIVFEAPAGSREEALGIAEGFARALGR